MSTLAPDTKENKEWAVTIFQCGNFCECCLYVCFHPCYGIADSRSSVDGSNWGANYCCLSSCAVRWLVRTAYGIEGDAREDCLYGTFCYICSINQVLQTVHKYGKPKVEFLGPQFNTVHQDLCKRRSCPDLMYDCCYGTFCNCCANGIALQSIGMPCWFGCCCVTSFTTTSILRFHYRKVTWCSNEAFVDFVAPICCSFALPFYACLNLAEENVRQNRTGCYGWNEIATGFDDVVQAFCSCKPPVKPEYPGYLHREPMDNGEVPVPAMVAENKVL